MISRSPTNGKVQRATAVRCAIYTRKSTDEGLDKDFNSLDAQYEACADYVRSQRHDGWTLLPDRFDDGGYTGANDRRPGLQALLAAVEEGRVQVVVVHRIDRLSRSLSDFVRLMALFDKMSVAFVSVTQQFSTGTAVGRLTLNLLSCFSEFEREMIAERTRDKVRAARRRGKWTGGPPPLGYDVAPEGGRIVVNEKEAKRVREIFRLYLELGSFTAVAQRLNRRRWRTKAWTTRDGRQREGVRWTKCSVRTLLLNPIYIGKTRLKKEVFDGEHPAILDQGLFDRVQVAIAKNGRAPGKKVGGRKGSALLAGILRCAPCDAAMVQSSTRRGQKAYRYYICSHTNTAGWAACPSPSVPAHEMERLVVDQIRAIGRDRRLRGRVLKAVRDRGEAVDEADLRRALALFDPVWEALHAREQKRVLALLVERVAYDGAAGTAEITFRPSGIRTLAEEVEA